MEDTNWLIPEKTKQDLAECAAMFRIATGASFEDINKFMVDVIKIYSDYMDKVTEDKTRH